MPYTDNFDRGDESPLSGGGNWTTIGAYYSPRVVSLQCVCQASPDGQAGSFYTAAALPAACYVKATIKNISEFVGILLRGSGTGTFYAVATGGGAGTGYTIHRYLNGGWQEQIASTTGVTAAVNDVIEFRANGTSLQLLVNGVTQINATHGTITAGGYSGVIFYGGATTPTALDTWESGSIAAILSGTAMASITETDVVTGGKTIIITLTGDTFLPA
jgi:hypothetical protein